MQSLKEKLEEPHLPNVDEQLKLNYWLPIKEAEFMQNFADLVKSVDDNEFITYHVIELKGHDTAYVWCIDTQYGLKAELLIIVQHDRSVVETNRHQAFVSRLTSEEILVR